MEFMNFPFKKGLLALATAALFLTSCGDDKNDPDPGNGTDPEVPEEKFTPGLAITIATDYERIYAEGDESIADLFTESDVVKFEVNWVKEEGKTYVNMDDPQLFVDMEGTATEITLVASGDAYVSEELSELFKDQMLEVYELTAKAESTDAEAAEPNASSEATVEIGKFGTMTLGVFGDFEDNNVYKTVKIGDQIWMAENLRTEKKNNGDRPYMGDEGEVENFSEIYGHSYVYDTEMISLQTALEQSGWHVPSVEEARTLFTTLGGIKDSDEWYGSYSNIINDVVSSDVQFWNFSGDFLGTNSSGLNFLGTGIPIDESGPEIDIFNLKEVTKIWLTPEVNNSQSVMRIISVKPDNLSVYGSQPGDAFVRLVK
ncbi:hypothetical protein PEDI_52670 [Persicobacter diffluens]|uniref:Fibrobacter succinogenes major paralogous domain-containing protein n=2 Tax=Persicobacter diffluens TaxID=981 RepID=A0AAN4W5X8_9BACT|nr:hypothetical protein PEDI_52670 [Persicobacter diffluens]